jgi:hypothetical protein
MLQKRYDFPHTCLIVTPIKSYKADLIREVFVGDIVMVVVRAQEIVIATHLIVDRDVHPFHRLHPHRVLVHLKGGQVDYCATSRLRILQRVDYCARG